MTSSGGCRFQFGSFFRRAPSVTHGADHLAVWLGTHSKAYGYGFNPYWHGRMLDRARETNATAVYYAYVIAMLARHLKGLKDCDVGTPSLCVHGADFVRQHERLILDTYGAYANSTAARVGRAARVVWLMEPDFHQYAESTQRGGGLPQNHMVRLFVAMVARIKRHLPAAQISLDISPWVSDFGAWIAPFLEHGSVDFLHTSGGRTTAAAARVRAQEEGNLLTWAEAHRVSGLGIIADTGYGVGGGFETGRALENAWSEWTNLRDRIADGVIAVTHANPGTGWASRASRLRSSLPPTRHCMGSGSGALRPRQQHHHAIRSLDEILE